MFVFSWEAMPKQITKNVSQIYEKSLILPLNIPLEKKNLFLSSIYPNHTVDSGLI